MRSDKSGNNVSELKMKMISKIKRKVDVYTNCALAATQKFVIAILQQTSDSFATEL